MKLGSRVRLLCHVVDNSRKPEDLAQSFRAILSLRDLGTGLWLHRQAYITVWIEETPASIGKEPLRVIVNGLHDFGPVQVLQSLGVFDVTRAGREKWREKERES